MMLVELLVVLVVAHSYGGCDGGGGCDLSGTGGRCGVVMLWLWCVCGCGVDVL